MADEQPFPVRQLLGGKIASQTQALAGMKRAEEEQASRFAEATQSQEAQAEAMAPVQKSLGELSGSKEAVSTLQKTAEKASARELATPELAKQEERISPGSIGLTRVPPYDYRWTWNAQDGGASASVSADNRTGQVGFDIRSNNVRGHAWGANGVGVYYRPVYNGTLHVWAYPAFNYNWATYATFTSCHSDGWLGLYVGQYNFSGDLDWVPVSQQIYQWRDDNFFPGTGGSGSNSGYPLSAWIPVNTAHWYGIWLWSGGSVYGDGWGPAWGSAAYSKLNIGVPSISMVLY